MQLRKFGVKGFGRNRMKGKNNKIYSFLICVMLLVGLCPITARADIGPKPSVTVTIEGLEGETY